MANWVEIEAFFKAKYGAGGNSSIASATEGTTAATSAATSAGAAAGAAASSSTRNKSGRLPAPPKVEQELIQLNVALQTEIVRFTVLGIQRAVRDVEESMIEQERLSSGGVSFFVSCSSFWIQLTFKRLTRNHDCAVVVLTFQFLTIISSRIPTQHSKTAARTGRRFPS